jgi:tRNA A-37 threonylcarbamoyl transferase component Bud32
MEAPAKQNSEKLDLEQAEQEFYRKLAQLPKELSRLWLSKYEDLDDDATAFFAEFDTFINNRNNALSGTLEIHTDTNEEIREEILSVHQSIKDTFGDTNYFLGNGRTAEVYTLPVAPHLCVKYIYDQAAYNENNHMRTEYEFLDRLHSFQVNNIRTPHPYFIRIHPSEGHTYGMEKIAGENLSRILEQPTMNVELIRQLKESDRDAIENDLATYVAALHETFNITHNDLFQRNIMVDGDGRFYIIDFGKAKYQELGDDHEQLRNSDIALLISEIRKFFQAIDKIDINDIIERD